MVEKHRESVLFYSKKEYWPFQTMLIKNKTKNINNYEIFFSYDKKNNVILYRTGGL